MPSSKVLVTNLHNLTQPLIRYELTDRFTQAAPAKGGWLRVGVDGRADDLFRYAAASVHPFVIGAVLARAPAVREFQVRQTDRGAAVVDAPDFAALSTAVEHSLRRASLPHPQVIIRWVDALDRDALTSIPGRSPPLSVCDIGTGHRLVLP